jgi:hypothetical protein
VRGWWASVHLSAADSLLGVVEGRCDTCLEAAEICSVISEHTAAHFARVFALVAKRALCALVLFVPALAIALILVVAAVVAGIEALFG